MRQKHLYAWVIRSKEKTYRSIFGKKQHGYFATRTSIQNPRFVTTFHWSIKLFGSKEGAETFYFAKTRKGFDTKPFYIRRLKLFLKKGEWDYFKNKEVFRK